MLQKSAEVCSTQFQSLICVVVSESVVWFILKVVVTKWCLYLKGQTLPCITGNSILLMSLPLASSNHKLTQGLSLYEKIEIVEENQKINHHHHKNDCLAHAMLDTRVDKYYLTRFLEKYSSNDSKEIMDNWKWNYTVFWINFEQLFLKKSK